MGLVTQTNNLGPLTQKPYDVWDLCPAPFPSGRYFAVETTVLEQRGILSLLQKAK